MPPVTPPATPGPINGMRRLASALHFWEMRQEVNANNVANAETQGFKAERTFARLMGDALPALGTTTDLRAGTITPTGNQLDLALSGDGFFVVATVSGERLTRRGAFQLDTARRIVTDRGDLVLGENGPITVPEGVTSIAVDATGAVTIDGPGATGRLPLDRLRIETVQDPTTLSHEGEGLFAASGPRIAVAPDARRLRQGALEESNADSMNALVDMITITRNFASVEEATKTLDEVRGTIVNQLGKPA